MFTIKKRLLFFSVEFVGIYLNISETFRKQILLKIKLVHRFRKLLKRYNSINCKPCKYSNWKRSEMVYCIPVAMGIFSTTHIQSKTMEVHLHCCRFC